MSLERMSDLCAISHEPLDACAVTAACGHRFNPYPWEEYYNYEVNSMGMFASDAPFVARLLAS